jgi:ABC-type transport system involved in multi-copper enzyme maturation permease subunit
MKKLLDNLYLATAIARKDIGETLKYKASRTNILILFGMLLFFYWGSAVRPYDKDIHVAYIDEGSTNLVEITAMAGENTYRFREVFSLEEMSEDLLASELGVIFPEDFDEQLETEGQVALEGYIPWVHRARVSELEDKFSAGFSTLTEKTVRIEIGDNFLQPEPHARNNTPIAIFMYLMVFMALSTVPYLMLMEKQTKTMDALLVSPVGSGTLVLGKALAGFFYVGVTAVVYFIVYAAYITNWGLAVFTALLVSFFAIGLALLIGSLASSPQQMAIWNLPIILLVVLPAFFSGEAFLPDALNLFFSWIPTTAMAEIFRFSLSSGIAQDLIWRDLALSTAGIALVYAGVVAILRRADR